MVKRVIKSTDENALEDLKKRLNSLETTREGMKARNKYYKQKGTMKGYEGMDDIRAESMNETAQKNYCKLPYAPYQLQNLAQDIRRTKLRIKELEMEQNREEEVYDTEGLGFEIVENKEIGRLQIIFSDKAEKKVWERLRHSGFVFSRTNQAFQRQLNENARRAAKSFIKEQREMEAEM